MSCNRSRAFFTRQRRNNRRSSVGVAGGRAVQSGSFVRIDAIESEIVLPGNAWRPVSISYRTHPNAQMSARSSTELPRACSGLM